MILNIADAITLTKMNDVRKNRSDYEKNVMRKYHMHFVCEKGIRFNLRISYNLRTHGVGCTSWFHRTSKGRLPMINVE